MPHNPISAPPSTTRQPPSGPRSPDRPDDGFTLLEVILAVAVAGALLAAAASLMVSVADAWMDRQNRHFFEDHVDGVTEFLQTSFIASASEITVTSSNNINGAPSSGQSPTAPGNPQDGSTALLRQVEQPITWERPPGFASLRDPLLHFRLKERPVLLVQPDNAPITEVEVFLYFETDEGLSLLWYSPIQEDFEDINDLRRTPISDLVKKIEYIYWNESFERWDEEDRPKKGKGGEEFLLPRFLRLTFEYEGVEKTRALQLPVPSMSVLIF